MPSLRAVLPLVFAVLAALSSATPVALQAAKLKRTTFEDRTGSVGLPAGWDIESAYRGQVQVGSGKGDYVMIGMPWTVLKPDRLQDLPAAGTVANARPGDLTRALAEVLAKNNRARLISVRSRRGPSIVAGAPGAYLMYEFETGGVRYSALGYFTTLDYGPSSPSWQLYGSAVFCPKPRFTKSLPTMMAIWKSWRVTGAEPAFGSQSAELDKVLNGRRDSYQKIQEQFRKEL